MKRNKKIIVVSHCLLNVNAKIDGLAPYKGASSVISDFIAAGYGIIQLPCIEQAAYGAKRWGTVYSQSDFPGFREKCRELLKPVADQLEDFALNGYSIAAVIGIDGSPTCGVKYRPEGNWCGEVSHAFGLNEKIESCRIVEGMGVMMEEFSRMLADRGLDIPFRSVNEERDNVTAEQILLSL